MDEKAEKVPAAVERLNFASKRVAEQVPDADAHPLPWVIVANKVAYQAEHDGSLSGHSYFKEPARLIVYIIRQKSRIRQYLADTLGVFLAFGGKLKGIRKGNADDLRRTAEWWLKVGQAVAENYNKQIDSIRGIVPDLPAIQMRLEFLN